MDKTISELGRTGETNSNSAPLFFGGTIYVRTNLVDLQTKLVKNLMLSKNNCY